MNKRLLESFEKKILVPTANHVSGRMTTGLFILLGYVILYWAIKFVVSNADTLLEPLIKVMPIVKGISGIGLLLLLIISYILGLAYVSRPGRKLIEFIQHATMRIPGIKSIYKPVKGGLEIFTKDPSIGSSAIVVVPLFGQRMFGVCVAEVLVNGEKHISLLYLNPPPTPNPAAPCLVPEWQVEDVFVVEETSDGEKTRRPMTGSDYMKYWSSFGASLPFEIETIPRCKKEKNNPA